MDLKKQNQSSGSIGIDNTDLESAGDSKNNSSKANIETPTVNPTLTITPHFVPPDGGKKAWLCVMGAFCSVFVSFGWITCIGTLQDYYQRVALPEYSPSTISWIASTEVCLEDA